jgi:hypothetical protein
MFDLDYFANSSCSKKLEEITQIIEHLGLRGKQENVSCDQKSLRL